MLVVPMTRDEGLAHRSFAERIEPTPDNGADTTCWALAHHVTSVSLRRVNRTASWITAEQLSSIRQRIRIAVGASFGPASTETESGAGGPGCDDRATSGGRSCRLKERAG